MLNAFTGNRGNGAAWTTSEPWVRLGLRSIAVLVAALLVFGWLVHINGAVVASGTVTVENNYKTIQHLDGGIVAKIHVRNGDRVDTGAELISLDETADRANLAVVSGRIHELQIQQARLEAERDRLEKFALPAQLGPASGNQQVARILKTQKALFDARLQSRKGEQAVLSQRIEQLTAQMAGLEAQREARQKEEQLTQRELGGLRQLFEKGFASRQRLTTLERDHARLLGDIGRLTGDLARVQGQFAEARLRKAQAEKGFTESVVDELRKTEAALSELEENRIKLQDKLQRAVIRAPQSGRVHALQIHTEGGVISPAKALLQIIPEGERLIVEAQVPVAQVDRVAKGAPADIRFPAFNARSTPRLSGRVQSVSPAQLQNRDGQPYFSALIEIPAQEMQRIGLADRLVPGMPAEIYIETGSRSILSYFLKPLVDSMFPAFRES